MRLAAKFKSQVSLERIDNAVIADAKSILSVLTLAASKGTVLKLIVEGEDEQKAFQEIEEIFFTGFGEL